MSHDFDLDALATDLGLDFNAASSIAANVVASGGAPRAARPVQLNNALYTGYRKQHPTATTSDYNKEKENFTPEQRELYVKIGLQQHAKSAQEHVDEAKAKKRALRATAGGQQEQFAFYRKGSTDPNCNKGEFDYSRPKTVMLHNMFTIAYRDAHSAAANGIDTLKSSTDEYKRQKALPAAERSEVWKAAEKKMGEIKKLQKKKQNAVTVSNKEVRAQNKTKKEAKKKERQEKENKKKAKREALADRKREAVEAAAAKIGGKKM